MKPKPSLKECYCYCHLKEHGGKYTLYPCFHCSKKSVVNFPTQQNDTLDNTSMVPPIPPSVSSHSATRDRGWEEEFDKGWFDKFGISKASLSIKVGDNSNFSYGTFYTFFKSFISSQRQRIREKIEKLPFYETKLWDGGDRKTKVLLRKDILKILEE